MPVSSGFHGRLSAPCMLAVSARTALAFSSLIHASKRCLATSPVMTIPSVTLNDGTQHPIIGYGTYKVGVVPASASNAAADASTDTAAVNPADCVAAALELGYRFLDCAEFYANEPSVGEGIARSGVPRSELYLASKIWTTTIHAGPEAVQAQLVPPAALRAEEQLAHPLASQRAWRGLAVGSGRGWG